VLVLVVMTVAGRLAGSAFSTDLTGGSTQSQQAASFLRENFPAQAGDNPRYTGRQVWNRQRYDVQRWNLPDGWVISARPAHPALVSEADFSAAQDISAARGPAPSTGLAAPRRRIYLLAGLLVCGVCGRRMESAWSNGKPAYRCRYGHTSAASPDPGRSPNAYIREDRLLTHLPALYLLLAGAQSAGERARRQTAAGPTSGLRPARTRRSGTCVTTRSSSPGTRPRAPCRRAPPEPP
jgi:hypothetical protein